MLGWLENILWTGWSLQAKGLLQKYYQATKHDAVQAILIAQVKNDWKCDYAVAVHLNLAFEE